MKARAGTICICRSGPARRSPGACRQAGFSLIELVVVIVLLGIAAVALLQQFSQAAGSLGRNEQLQTAAQLAQQGAEQVLALRRASGYADPGLNPGSSTENLAGLFAGYSRTVTISAPAAGACPPLALCKDVQVTVDRGAGTLARIELVLVDY